MVPNRRAPAQPRQAEAAYRRWARAVLALWSHTALDLAERSRTEMVTRADIERAWAGILTGANMGAALLRASQLITRSQASYWRALVKQPPRPFDVRTLRSEWIRENVLLWNKLGNELADRLVEVLGQVRLDAKAPNVTRAVNAARKANVGLVSGLDVKQTLQLGKLLKAGQEQGVRHETLIEQVQEVTGFGESRARLIARDQTVKHNAAVQEAQARALGITKYTWRTTRLENVRPMHRALEGTVHSYNDPPVTNKAGDRNHPGGDFQCACQAVPILDLFAGLSDE